MVDPRSSTPVQLENPAWLASFPERNPNPIAELDAAGHVAYLNPAARALFPDLQQRGTDHPWLAGWAEAVRSLRAGAGVHLRLVRTHGRCFQQELQLLPENEHIRVYGSDITERDRAVAALAAERERLAVTLGSIGDAVIATDELSRVTMLNQVAEELTGWKSEEAAGKRLREVFNIVNEETRQPAFNPVDRVLRDGVVVGLANHTALIARDGTERPIADSAAPIRDSSGRTSGVVLVFRDQTEERQVEQTLRESEQRIRLKLDSLLSPEGDIGKLELADIIDARVIQQLMDDFHKVARLPLSLIDVRGKVLVGVGWQDVCTKFHRVHPETCQKCVESDTELSADVLPGKFKLYKCKNDMWNIATPLSVAGHHMGNIFSGQFFFEDEPVDYDRFRAQAARYGFDERAYLAALEAVPRPSRESVAAVMSFFLKFADLLSRLSYSNIQLARSAAEREVLMLSLRESKERLEEADHRKNEFLGVLSHELRNPLAPIRNAVHLLDLAEPGGQQATRATAVIARQVEHLSHLVDDLLDVTRISRGKIQLARTRLELTETVRRVVEDHALEFARREITLELRSETRPLWLDADPTRIAQVLGNLLQNAAKFTNAHGRVTVSVDREGGDRAVVRVADDGVGIKPELLPRLFEPFMQADESLHRSQGGLGLGLALMRGLVELHGGTVHAHSEGVGRGAEFTLRLPLVDMSAEATGEAPARAFPPSARRVLIIEDNLDSAETLAELLSLAGHDVEIAHDGPAGLQKALSSTPDVVVCDIGLPGMSGYDVARAMRAEPSLAATLLVALTGYALPEDRQQALRAGFDHHLAKPVGLDELELVLGRATTGVGPQT